MTESPKRGPRLTAAVLILAFGLTLVGCGRERPPGEGGGVRLVFKHGKLFGDPRPLEELLETFERRNPGITVASETLPASSDEQHQFYVINLEGRSKDFDVLAMDVIWVAEFARAGWLRDLSHLVPPGGRGEFFSGPMEAALYSGRLYAVPWYVDAGLLYYRSDLLAKHGFSPPATWAELVRAAREITLREPGLYGYIWQGKQYEGLVCNALEFIWSHGGEVLDDGRVVIESPENVRALGLMRDLIERYGATPGFVTTTTEEPARRLFGRGKAVFMRNWPYAWTLLEREASEVRGRVGVAPLPASPGGRSAPALGGWHLGVNRFSPNPAEAERLVGFLASEESQKALALAVGYQPTLRRLYEDRELVRAQPFTAGLAGVFEGARPRPVSPYYMMLSQVMQLEFSAVVAGVKPPEAALGSARKQMEFILRVEEGE